MTLNEFEAQQFALLQLSGVPAYEAVGFFLPSAATEEAREKAALDLPRQPEVAKAMQRLSGGKPWQELRSEERINLAIEKHYAEMAYFLWTHNYAELSGPDKMKADTCRQALEAKLAGTAGKGNALDRFYESVIDMYKKQIKVGVA